MNLIHPLARAIVIDQNHILLRHKKTSTQNFYYLPGGHIEPNEKASDAVIREMVEESGHACRVEHFLGCIEDILEYTIPSLCHSHAYHFIFLVSSPTLQASQAIAALEEPYPFIWIPLTQLDSISLYPKALHLLIPQWLQSGPKHNHI